MPAVGVVTKINQSYSSWHNPQPTKWQIYLLFLTRVPRVLAFIWIFRMPWDFESWHSWHFDINQSGSLWCSFQPIEWQMSIPHWREVYWAVTQRKIKSKTFLCSWVEKIAREIVDYTWIPKRLNFYSWIKTHLKVWKAYLKIRQGSRWLQIPWQLHRLFHP